MKKPHGSNSGASAGETPHGSQHAPKTPDSDQCGAPLPWERQPGESSKSYQAFSLYLNLGPGRDVSKAFRARPGGKPSDTPSGIWKRWSSVNFWTLRATAYDAHLDQLRFQQQEEAVKAQTAAAVRRREAVPTLEYRAGRLGMLDAIKRLKQPGSSMKGVASLMRVASDLMRRATGLPITTIEDKPPSMDGILFESRGQLAAVLPPGVLPEMPVDPTAKPDLGQSVALGGASPLTKPKGIARP